MHGPLRLIRSAIFRAAAYSDGSTLMYTRSMADDLIEYKGQEEFVEWCFDEPHAGIHVFGLTPLPLAGTPPNEVTMEWASPDLSYEGPGPGSGRSVRLRFWHRYVPVSLQLVLLGFFSAPLS